MDFIGSKLKLHDWILNTIGDSVGASKDIVFLDACSGSGIISQQAAQRGYKVIASDLMMFPSVIVNGSIGLTDRQLATAEKHIDKLNALKGRKGYFYKNFSGTPGVKDDRLYFTEANAMRIDAVREAIDNVRDAKVRDYLLYCGLEAVSRVSNTTGVQAAYLKEFKERARQEFLLRKEQSYAGTATGYCEDVLHLLNRKHSREDILYIDPPYNHRQYGPNYHLYETFVRNDNPTPIGMTGLRDWQSECKSEFCSSKSCLSFLRKLIEATTARVVAISYNSDGLLTQDEIISLGKHVFVFEQEQRR